jgi:hypothetical protein
MTKNNYSFAKLTNGRAVGLDGIPTLEFDGYRQCLAIQQLDQRSRNFML